MKTVEDLTELNKIKLNQLFKYINNYIFQAIRSKKQKSIFYSFKISSELEIDKS